MVFVGVVIPVRQDGGDVGGWISAISGEGPRRLALMSLDVLAAQIWRCRSTGEERGLTTDPSLKIVIYQRWWR